MVAGDIVYLKYFQKSQRALRLNRQASANSVKESRGQKNTINDFFKRIVQKINCMQVRFVGFFF